MGKFLDKLFVAIDKKDIDSFISFLTEDACFTFANMPAVCGKKNVRDAVSGFFSGIKGLSHNISQTWEKGDTLICEGKVTYTRNDSKEMTFPFVNIFRMRDSLIADYRIYTDNSALYK